MSNQLTKQSVPNASIANVSVSNVSIPIIGIHHSPLSQKFGIPRQPNLVNLPTVIEMYPPYDDPAAFVGIEAFSHLWISWHFHQNRPQATFRPQVRPPRLGGNDKLGVFATRSMYRPSQLGLSVVQLQEVAVVNGKVQLCILGADMVDGTPIIDIKPYVAYSDSHPQAISGFASDKPILKPVDCSKQAQQHLTSLIANHHLQPNDIDYICQLIAQDPRPAYRQQELGSEFVMRFAQVDVTFTMETSGLDDHQSSETERLIIKKLQFIGHQ